MTVHVGEDDGGEPDENPQSALRRAIAVDGRRRRVGVSGVVLARRGDVQAESPCTAKRAIPTESERGSEDTP
jgi:hypothetical protein